MAACQRDAGKRADRSRAFQYLPGAFRRQLVHRPAKDGDGYNWSASHRINITDRIDRGDPPKFVGIIDYRHKKIGGGDQGPAIAKIVYGRVVAFVIAHEQGRVARPSCRYAISYPA